MPDAVKVEIDVCSREAAIFAEVKQTQSCGLRNEQNAGLMLGLLLVEQGNEPNLSASLKAFASITVDKIHDIMNC